MTLRLVKSDRPRIEPTEEQQAIIDAPEVGDISINAGAGATKTTTLRLRAEAHPNQRILYVALNKSVQVEAEQEFPDNVVCLTTHALAYRSHGARYRHKLGNLRPYSARELIDSGLNDKEALFHALNCMEGIKRFLASSSREISREHLPVGKVASLGVTISQALTDTKRLCDMMIDPENHKALLPHDGYLKLYQLSEPDLSRQFDAIFLDEAQDTNPAMYDIFMSQKGLQRVAVGDRNQSIYRFRGSMDVMAKMTHAEKFSLTGSFRFGPEVAGLANALLDTYLDDDFTLRGLGKSTKIVPSAEEDREMPLSNRAYIYRTNAGLFTQAVDLLKSDVEQMNWVGGIESYQMNLILDVFYLYDGRRKDISDKLIKKFSDMEDLRSYVERVGDLELKARIKVVDKYGSKIPYLIDALRKAALSPEQAKKTTAPILTTAHRSKGSEFDHVVLGDDYASLISRHNGQVFPLVAGKIPPDAKDEPVREDEIYLIYVAATRAKKVLGVNPELVSLILWAKKERERPDFNE